MTVVHWKPFNNMLSLQEEVNRLFNTYFSGAPESTETGEYHWNPAVDIFEDENSIKVMCEVPGVEKEDVKISIQDNVLTVSGEKKRDFEGENGSFYRVERLCGKFQRSFSLPSSVDQENVKATYKNGILTINLPKEEEAKPKEVSIAIK